MASTRMFRVTVEVDQTKIKAMKEAPEKAMQALQAGANYWHEKVLPKHFDKPAHGRYGYADRAQSYLKDRRKGAKPDLVFSGSLRHDLQARAAFIAGSRTLELRMSARVLNFVPNMQQNNDDLYVKHKSGRGYPNLKREIKVVLEEERQAIAQVVQDELARLFGA